MILSKVRRRGLKIISPNHWANFFSMSFSQNGEDILLDAVFQGKQDGFFVDVGAHHPYRFSNTYRLYRAGWRGLNIDPLPGNKDLFDRLRPRDENVEVGIASHAGRLHYWSFREPAYNTFDEQLARARVDNGVSDIVDVIEVETAPLADLLRSFIPEGIAIDLMSVDVEGFDYQVLETNDWEQYRPHVVMAEVLNADFESMKDDPVYQLMKTNGYALNSKTHTSALFVDTRR